MQVLVKLLMLIAIGLIAGWLAAVIVGERRRYGVVGYVIVGAIGAIAGNYVFGSLQLPNVGLVPQLVAAFAGSVTLLLLLKLVRR